MQVRSFRAVFEAERRVYRIDTIRLNPGGVPLRSLVYAAILIVATAIAARLPLIGWLLSVLPWYLRYLGMPIAAAAALSVVRIDGRPFHLAVVGIVARHAGSTTLHGLRPCARAGSRWRPPTLVVIADGSDGGFRRLRYRGPGLVMVCRSHRRYEWRRRGPRILPGAVDVRIAPHEPGGSLTRASCIELASRAVLEVAGAGTAG